MHLVVARQGIETEAFAFVRGMPFPTHYLTNSRDSTALGASKPRSFTAQNRTDLTVTFTDTLSASDHVRGVISYTVHSRCTHCECCGTMASAKLVFRQFSGRSLCLG